MPKAKRRRPQGSQSSQGSQGSQGSGANRAQPPQPGARPATGANSAANASQRASQASSEAQAARIARRNAARAQQPSRRYARQPWWRRNLGALITVGAAVVIVVGLIIWAQLQSRAQNNAAAVGIGDPAPVSVLQPVTSVSPTVAAKVGAGGVQSPLQATPRGTPLLTENGKPLVVYVGADWCPYCAATRWSTVVALSRFGSFSGLTLMRSSSTDTLPNTATFSFQNATYTSQYIAFSATETADRNQNPLATPPPAAATAEATYNVPPYTPQADGIPFLSYGNQYVETSGLFVPTMLQGLDWQQIAGQLNDPNSQVTQAIVGGANVQTAAICKLTNNQPGSVCNTAVIQQLEASLPQPK